MGLKVEDYKNLLMKLLPKGKAWEFGPEATFIDLLYAIADELVRIDGRVEDLLNEADPRTTYEMLEDWERVMGLPDTCTGLAATIEERRNQIVAKLIRLGRQNKQFFIDLAATIGYSVEIEEYDIFKVGSQVGDPVYGLEWMHAFGVIAPLNQVKPFRANQNYVGDRIMEFGDHALECLINQTKPAHSVALFIYQ